jgi:hypothetical protein
MDLPVSGDVFKVSSGSPVEYIYADTIFKNPSMSRRSFCKKWYLNQDALSVFQGCALSRVCELPNSQDLEEWELDTRKSPG